MRTLALATLLALSPSALADGGQGNLWQQLDSYLSTHTSWRVILNGGQDNHAGRHDGRQGDQQQARTVSERELAAFLASVDQATFGRDQVALVRSFASRNQFTVGQITHVLEQLTFDSDKLAALQALAPKAIDPRNAYLVGNQFTFSSYRDQALALFA